MIKLALLLVTTGVALVVAVAVPVVIVSGTGYGLVALNRRWTRSAKFAAKSSGV